MIALHHVNIVSRNVGELAGFYTRALGLEEGVEQDQTETGASIEAALLRVGDQELHLTEQRVNLGVELGQHVNPVAHGHVAFRTDDIESVKSRLEAEDIPYSDFGEWAVHGWYQIFFVDPVGTVVEVHQVR